MEGAAATAIALIGLMFVALVLFLIVRRMTPSRSLVPTESQIGPVYKQDPKPAEYYRPIREIEQINSESKEGVRRSLDLRSVPLPRCPACGSAAAYGQETCSKCGYQLKIIAPLKR